MKIKYLFLVPCLMGLLLGCTEDDGNWLEPGNGIPSVKKIVDPNNYHAAITTANLDQIIEVYGENLTSVEKITINDVEVIIPNQATITNNTIVIRVPRVLPTSLNNKLILENAYGKGEYDLVISVPQLKVYGMLNEYTPAGGTVTIIGENFDLYNVTPKDGRVVFGTEKLAITKTTASTIEFTAPATAPDNVKISLEYPSGTTECPGKYRDNDYMLDDFEGSTWRTQWVVNAGADASITPRPIQGAKYCGFVSNDEAWKWVDVVGNSKVPTSEQLANVNDYVIKFEIYTRQPMKTAGLKFVVKGKEYQWEPFTESVPFDTKGKWQTVSIPLSKFAGATGSNFVVLRHTAATGIIDVCMDNFRVSKK